jgi:hypothetical protein
MLPYADFVSETISSKQYIMSFTNYRKHADQDGLTNGISVLSYERGGRFHVAIRDASTSPVSLGIGKITPSS